MARIAELSLPQLLRPMIPDDDELSAAQSPITVQIPKRQRRLTLTAMTGALGDISREPCNTSMDHSKDGGSLAGFGMGWTPAKSETVLQPLQSLLHHDDGCHRPPAGAKRDSMGRARSRRDSIGSDAGPEVMAIRAARRFFKAGRKSKAPVDMQSVSSDTDEEGAAVRQRRQRAFECGVQTAEGRAGISEGWAATVNAGIALSPRSFARGAKAAEVAAKAAAEIHQKRSAAKAAAAKQGRSRARRAQCGSLFAGIPKNAGA